jgi:Flp pilus assembly pilin Flp
MKELMHRFWCDESGTAAMEYGIISAMVSVPIMVAGRAAAEGISGVFNQISDAMNVRP